MKLLKYESFLETMQFSVLTNAQRLAKQEADRKDKQEEEEKAAEAIVKVSNEIRKQYKDI